MFSRIAAGALATLICLAPAGCTSAADPAPQDAGSTTSTPTEEAPDPRIAAFTTSDPAARDAYAFAAAVALRFQFNSEYLRLALPDMVASDFDEFEPLLTPTAFKALTTAVGGAATNPDQVNTVRALTFVDFPDALTGTDLSMPDDDQMVTDQKISEPKYELTSDHRTIWLTSSGNVAVKNKDVPASLSYAVRMKLQLLDTNKDPRIDAWTSNWAFNGEKPAEIP